MNFFKNCLSILTGISSRNLETSYEFTQFLRKFLSKITLGVSFGSSNIFPESFPELLLEFLKRFLQVLFHLFRDFVRHFIGNWSRKIPKDFSEISAISLNLCKPSFRYFFQIFFQRLSQQSLPNQVLQFFQIFFFFKDFSKIHIFLFLQWYCEEFLQIFFIVPTGFSSEISPGSS